MNAIIEFFKTNFTREVAVIILAMLPIIELRGAIPVGISLGMDYKNAFITSFLGSSFPAIPIVFLIGYVFLILRKIKLFDKLISKITEKTLNKKEQIEKYGYFGLFLFVAIPLPGTGVWTGSLLSHLLGMDKIKSLIAIILGNLAAGIIVTALSVGIKALF